jgi:glycosyltransferase involved in cell wall biosynthesis
MSDVTFTARPVGLSVVIPTYKRIHPTLRAIDSVRTRKPSSVEIVVVDDGSPDDPSSHFPPWNACGINVRVFRLHKNCGPQAARNLGIRRANFSHIAFLDSDDEFLAEKVDTILSLIVVNDVDLIFHAVSGMSRYHKFASFWDKHLRRVLPFNWLCVLYNPVVTPSLVIRRRFCLGYTGLRHCEDWAYLLHYVTSRTSVVYLHRELAVVHREVGSSGGISAAIWQMRKGEFKGRLMLLRSPITFQNVLRWFLGTGVGLMRFASDLLHFRYGRRVVVE